MRIPGRRGVPPVGNDSPHDAKPSSTASPRRAWWGWARLFLGTAAAQRPAEVKLIDFADRLVPPEQIARQATRGRWSTFPSLDLAPTSTSSPSAAGTPTHCEGGGPDRCTSSATISTASPGGRRRRTTRAGMTVAWRAVQAGPATARRRRRPRLGAASSSASTRTSDGETWKPAGRLPWFSGDELGPGSCAHRRVRRLAPVRLGGRRRRHRKLEHRRAPLGVADEGVVGANARPRPCSTSPSSSPRRTPASFSATST